MPGTSMRPRLRRVVLTLALAAPGLLAHAAVSVWGVSLPETANVGGTTLVLNGAGWRKRGYAKVDVSAIYLTSRVSDATALEHAAGPKRIQLVLLEDVSGLQAERYFVSDFELVATRAEFAQVIGDVAEVGGLYAGLPRLRRGDIVTIDYVPGKGILAQHNGEPMVPVRADSPWIGSALFMEILLRIHLAGKVSTELRANLLGLSTSMRDAGPAAETPTARQCSVSHCEALHKTGGKDTVLCASQCETLH